MSTSQATIGIPDLLFRGVTVRGFWLVTWVGAMTPEDREEALAAVMGYLADGTLSPYHGKRFPLSQVREAIAEATRDARGGKVLLEG